MNVSISKGCLPLKLMCQWTKKPFKVSPEFRAFWVLIRPLLSHVFSPFKKIVCYIYWRCLHLLMIVPYSAAYTKEILFIAFPLGHLIPALLQNIWIVISSLSCPEFLITLCLFFLNYSVWCLFWAMFFRIYTCIACAKEQVASWLLKFFKNRIYLYASNSFCFPHCVELSDRTV